MGVSFLREPFWAGNQTETQDFEGSPDSTHTQIRTNSESILWLGGKSCTQLRGHARQAKALKSHTQLPSGTFFSFFFGEGFPFKLNQPKKDGFFLP